MTKQEVVSNKHNLGGANLSNADLHYADLHYANLYCADLRGAHLGGANLRYADLRGADLHYANLRGANLSNANLGGADLRYANLRGANLDGANLSNADLHYANLYCADLRGANLGGANLYCADLRGAHLSRADLRDAIIPIFSIVPEEGSFIGWKKLSRGVIAKLLIPAEARRTSVLTGRKNRAEFAVVLSLSDGTTGVGAYDASLVYAIGEVVRPDSYDDDIRVECTHGIHFFITKQEAVDY